MVYRDLNHLHLDLFYDLMTSILWLSHTQLTYARIKDHPQASTSATDFLWLCLETRTPSTTTIMVPKQASAIQVFLDLSDLLKLKKGQNWKTESPRRWSLSFFSSFCCFKMISQGAQEWRCPKTESWKYLQLPSLTKIGCLWSCLKSVPELLPSSLEINSLGMFVKNDDWAIHSFSTMWWS